MIQNICYGVILLLFSSASFASSKKVNFLKKLKSAEGTYKVSVGSHKSCSEGMLQAVGGSFERGIRLGQDIYFGPMDEPLEKETKSSCRVQNKFKFESNKLTQITELSKCPGELKKDEGISTSVLMIEGSVVKFSNLESHLNCTFKRSKVSQ